MWHEFCGEDEQLAAPHCCIALRTYYTRCSSCICCNGYANFVKIFARCARYAYFDKFFLSSQLCKF